MDEIAYALKSSFEKYFGRAKELKDGQFDEIISKANGMVGMFVWKR